MLKPLTLSFSLAVALGASSMALAGGHGNGLPTPQALPTEQVVTASPQGETCAPSCAPAKKHCLKDLFARFHKPKCYTYTWVLKKKRVHGKHHGGCDTGACGAPTCDTCGVTPSGQYASPQGEVFGSGQAYGAGQTYGAGQAVGSGQTTGAGQLTPTSGNSAAPAGDEAPPPPATNPTADAPKTSSLLFLSPSGN